MGYSYYVKDVVARKIMQRIGVTLLTEEQTADFLKTSQLQTHAGSLVRLQEIKDCTNPAKVIFEKVHLKLPTIYVYEYNNVSKNAKLQPCGALREGDKVLNTDFSRIDIIKDFLTISKREKISSNIVIAPWHHYFGQSFTGYYDYMFYLAAKVCRIKDAVPEDEFNTSVISYPLADTPYEQEFLQLMGFDASRVFDSRQTQIVFNKCLLSNSQNYSYPDKEDVKSLRKHIFSKIKVPIGKRNRLYISRSGRRKIVEETELIAMLRKYGFEIVEDAPRTLTEQVALFSNADFIIGPHGAAFTNIIWCQPDTHLFELFSSNFVPVHFRYLADLMSLNYSAYSKGDTIAHNAKYNDEDIHVSVEDIEKCLSELLNKQGLPVADSEK